MNDQTLLCPRFCPRWSTSKLVRLSALVLLVTVTVGGCSGDRQPELRPADLLIISLSDLHSPYRRLPAVIPMVRELLDQNPGVPTRILLGGDLFEAANSVARASMGEADWQFLEILDRLAPVIVNLGNHEPDFENDLAAVVEQADRRGIETVTHLIDKRTGRTFSPAHRDLEIPGFRVIVHGVGTAAISTYPSAVRPHLEVPEWKSSAIEADLGIVLSHAGLEEDREILATLPAGSLLIGGHDHAHIVHRQADSLYLQGGSWARRIQATKVFFGEPNRFEVVERLVDPRGPVDQPLADLIDQLTKDLESAEDREIVGVLEQPLSFVQAIEVAALGIARAADAEIGFLGYTTFGDDLPVGAVSRAQFDAFLRFDGDLVRAEVDQATLERILARSNLDPATPFADRLGDYLCSSRDIVDGSGRRYTIATNGWSAANQDKYFGEQIDFRPVADARVKAAAATELFVDL